MNLNSKTMVMVLAYNVEKTLEKTYNARKLLREACLFIAIYVIVR